jgi:hypothetical protein
MCYAGMKKLREHFPCILENFVWIDCMRTNNLFIYSYMEFPLYKYTKK